MDLDNLPYVLCPDITTQDIRVTPFWFRPKGGGTECPVVHLENVPVGYHGVLDANGFVQRPEGWFVDATDKSERFWRSIFGPIDFVQRRPVKIYEPERVVFAPPPGPVKVIVTQYRDEHLEHLTKGAGVYGLDAQRAAKNDALRGAVNCRGAWPILKAACMDRLGRNPEDVLTFEYVWGTAKRYSLDSSDIPDHISHTLLLEKVVDRRRLTAQMERVIPISYQSTGAVSTLVWADWTQRCAFIGARQGGPIDVREFSDVDGLAQYLLDGVFVPIEEPSLQSDWVERVSQCQAETGEGDWTADLGDLDLPEQVSPEQVSTETAELSNPESVDSSPTEIHNEQTARSLVWDEVVQRLAHLSIESERRVPYARVICRHLLQTVLHQVGSPLSHPAYLNNLEVLIKHFSGVLNRESLEKHLARHSEELKELACALAAPQQGRYQLLRLLNSADAAHSFATTQLEANGGESNGWWWTGFTCGQIPGSDNWQLFKVLRNGDCQPVGTGLYRSARDADAALYVMARNTRLEVFRTSLREGTYFHGYATTTGHILRLSEPFLDEGQAREALEDSRLHYLNHYREPILWERESLSWNAKTVSGLLLDALEALRWPSALTDLNGQLSIEDNGSDVVLRLEGVSPTPVYPGTLLLGWATAFYRWASTALPEAFPDLVSPLVGRNVMAQIDLSLEDDLLDELAEEQREVEARLGTVALSILRQAISTPSEEAEYQIAGFIKAVEGEASPALLRILRNIALVSAQHSPYRKLTPAYREALRLGIDTNITPFAYAIARYSWYRLRWAGALSARVVATGAPGDDLAGELAPSGAALWEFGYRLERLMANDVLAQTQQQSRARTQSVGR